MTHRGRVLRLVPALAWMALIYALSDRPGLRVSEDPGVDEPLRSVAHVLVYGVLAVLLLVALGGPTARDADGASRLDGEGGRRRVALAFLLALAWGALDEAHQAFVPERTGGLDDWALDVMGAALGLAAYLWWLAARHRAGPETPTRDASGGP